MSEELARMEGSRPCLACGHDLLGQPIRRLNPHGILIARCSECGTVTPLQEYPVLGPWGRRLGGVLAAFYMFTCLILLIAHGCISWFLTYFNTYEGLRPIGRGLGELIRLNNPNGDFNGWRAYKLDLLDEISAAERSEVFSFTYLFTPDMIGGLTSGLLLAFLFGCFWSTYLLGLSRRWIWIPAVIAIAFGWFMTLTIIWSGSNNTAGMNLTELAMHEFGLRTSTFLMILWLIPALIGVALGRSICRLIASFVLPPRQRIALAPLWTSDGLKPPFRKWWDRH